ncbi:hypothetical protein B9Z55_020944 [Caenorhabditis nigoni]|uniref:Uncharacterized protein n=1 Tax=Caenorhabditis nigoni TaxID=1611254 RepID=A0A2G5TPU9_9PELO|nr:hypothetical protein B9Z55_020944 [Caenorhabditis nigoni]
MKSGIFSIFYHFVTSPLLGIYYWSLFIKFIIHGLLYNTPIEECELYFSKWALLAFPLYFLPDLFSKYVETNSKNLTTIDSYEKRSNQIIINRYEMRLKENLIGYLKSGIIYIQTSLTVSCNPWLFFPSLFVALLYNVSLYIFGFHLIYLSQTKSNFDHFV